ncbi:hypothetical protein TUZN_1997 [Thermoproteus uzoniensis 768-20]|uniref:Uncharacterized protein n=1 Tax=Thermoproteus uzoniensis (strain 768-20) TaxID=999630 RepID=F2L4V1_THEU7|nr:hypothetical protein [Thermoproteus uzoniensis]AEA13455.1 hypothetical protein TUZN_1997 [Thermoproteus uzoniensis 768-20]
MKSEFLNALLTYINNVGEKGTAVTIKIDRICGVDRRCSWYIYKYMNVLESKNLVVKWKKGTWIAERQNLDRIREYIATYLPRRGAKNISVKR